MIQDRAMLIKLSISQWTGQKKDKKITKETNTFYGAEQTAGYYSKALIAKSAVQQIQKIVGAVRTFHYANTLPWGDNNERLLPSKNYFGYTAKMREFSHQFNQSVHDFIAVYPSYIESAKVRLNGMFNPIDYPAADCLREKFHFATEVTPVPDAADFRVDLAQDEVENIRADIEQQIRKSQAEAMNELWQRLYDVVQKMADKLVEKDGVFRNSLVGNIQELTTLLPKLNVADDKDLARLCKDVEQKLCRYGADDLRKNKKARYETAYQARAITEAMEGYMGTGQQVAA